MIALTWQLIRVQSWRRLLVIAASSSAATIALLIVVSLLMLPEQPAEFLFAVVYDPSTRGGAVLALVLLLAQSWGWPTRSRCSARPPEPVDSPCSRSPAPLHGNYDLWAPP